MIKTPRWLPKIIDLIKDLSSRGKVNFTLKSLRELESLEMGLDETDVCEILAGLKTVDFKTRITSTITQEFLYVFTLRIADTDIYVKIALRANCIVISFHEDFKNED